jgi:hypothetical protein
MPTQSWGLLERDSLLVEAWEENLLGLWAILPALTVGRARLELDVTNFQRFYHCFHRTHVVAAGESITGRRMHFVVIILDLDSYLNRIAHGLLRSVEQKLTDTTAF